MIKDFYAELYESKVPNPTANLPEITIRNVSYEEIPRVTTQEIHIALQHMKNGRIMPRGISARRMSVLHSVPRSTVQDIINLYKSTGGVDQKTKTGRPSTITEANRRALRRIVKTNRRSNTKELTVLCGESIDLSPIETLWNNMKKQLRKNPARTVSELRAPLPNIWDNISPEKCARLVDRMPSKIKAVIANKGNH
ncbi:hypothetical protein ILUMI_22219 [Ignelater luminosus]|uniref:Paired domain-containing protein n=1 Tax=Ignelater luminosus TaxID=2038154 RepID=A0A8K0CEY1_IGNLU|nr:hypothetical protein ILUMI_22219 [Ignelater luminosus]